MDRCMVTSRCIFARKWLTRSSPLAEAGEELHHRRTFVHAVAARRATHDRDSLAQRREAGTVVLALVRGVDGKNLRSSPRLASELQVDLRLPHLRPEL